MTEPVPVKERRIRIVYLSPLRARAVDVKRRTGGHRVNTLAGHGGL
jgi:Lhr-like helicase